MSSQVDDPKLHHYENVIVFPQLVHSELLIEILIDVQIRSSSDATLL